MISRILSASFQRLRSSHRTTNRSFSTIYSWGTGDEGQLGHNQIIKSGISNTYVELSPKPILSLIDKNIVDISAGTTHSAAVSSDGTLYTWGSSEYGKLGHEITTDISSSIKLCMLPTVVPYFSQNNIKVKQAVCGEFHTGVLTTDGELYTFGWGGSRFSGAGALGTGTYTTYSVPQKVFIGGQENDIRLKAISAGRQHMLGLGIDNEVWSWGKGEYGRLGNMGNDDQLSPEPVEYFLEADAYSDSPNSGSGIRVKQISCGEKWSMALTEEGKVYVWGSNDHSQLGLGGGFSMDMFAMENYPRVIEYFITNNIKIQHVAAGVQHAIAISDKNEVFIWGMKMWMEPYKLAALSDQRIVHASCGNGFTFVINDAGQVFSWGKGYMMRNSGCLGLGHTKRTIEPEIVSSFQGVSIQKVSCGNKHGLALSGLPQNR